MFGLPGGTSAGVTLESDAPRHNNSSGGVRYLPESPGYLCHDKSAAPTSGQRQVLSEDPSIIS
jgi:hypothetical protein